MLKVRRSQILRYGVAVLTVAIALALKLLLKPWVPQEDSPFLVFFVPVMFSAWYGGIGPGVLTTAIAAIVADSLVLTPFNVLSGNSQGENLQMGLFVLEGLLLTGLITALQSAKQRAELSKLLAQHHEQSLRQSEEGFRLLVEGVKDYAIYRLDPKGYIVSWNEGAERIKGYRAEEIVGQHCSRFYTALDIALGKPDQNLKVAAEVGRFEEEEWRIRKDKSRFWANVVMTALRDDAGNLKGFAEITRDMSERKRAEEERNQLLAREQVARAISEASEQRYRFLADAMPQIVWTAQPDGWLDYYNQRWFDYTGLTLEETQGWGWQQVMHPDDLPLCIDRWRQAVETGESYEIEYRFKRASDGTYRWHLGRALPVRDLDGQIVKWFGTCTDIDDQKRAEEIGAQLLAREQATRALAEAATEMVQRLQAIADVAIAPLSLDDLLRELLSRISEILEADTAAILMMDAQNNSLVVRAATGLEENVRQEVRIPIGEGFAGRVALKRQPIIIQQDAHSKVYSSVLSERGIQSLMGAPLLVEDRAIGVIQVGTLRSRQFTKDDVHLLQLVAERAALAIDRARLYEAERNALTQAQEANRVKDEFLAIVSHELRTPMQSILGWAQLLRSRKLNEATITKALETVERNAKQQVKIIDDILDVSRIISGNIRLHIIQLNVVPIIEAAIIGVQPASEAKAIHIESVLDRSVGNVRADPDRLQQIVGNLLSNAIEFTPSGGKIEIRLERGENGSVENSSRRETPIQNPQSTIHNSYAQIAVSDTGEGISADFLPHVFEGFRQADGSLTRAHGGLGLGLTIVRYLVELHDGTVHAASEGEGKGATFVVQLPIVKAQVKSEEKAVSSDIDPSPLTPRLNSKTVASKYI